MKGAVLYTQNEAFLISAFSALREGVFLATGDGESLSVVENGRLLLMYLGDFESGRIDLIGIENKHLAANLNFYFIVECRWEELFCRVMKTIASKIQDTFMVLDSRGNLLYPQELDAHTIVL